MLVLQHPETKADLSLCLYASGIGLAMLPEVGMDHISLLACGVNSWGCHRLIFVQGSGELNGKR